MNDTIYRQDAIKAIKDNSYSSLCDDYIEINGYGAIKDIRALPSADRPQEWIPCSEKKPSDYGNYLIVTDDGSVDIGTYHPSDVREWSACDAYGFYWLDSRMEKVIAWMPLPKPWKGADE